MARVSTRQQGDAFATYGAKEVGGDGKAHKGYSYKTSRKLIESVVAKKEPQTNFLSELYGEDKDIAITRASTEYTDSKGKPVSLSPFQLKLVTAFAQVIDTELGEEKVQKYIRELPSQIEDRDLGNGANKRLPDPVRAAIDIPRLTKLVYGRARVGGKDIDKVREEITRLSQIKQVFKYKDSRGGTLIIRAPIITLGKELIYQTKEEIVKLNKVEVVFEDVFVYEINERYSLAPITLLQLWNETGVQTELFAMLLSLLQGVRGNYIKNATAAANAKRIELKKAKVGEDAIKAEVAKLLREKLTYRESVASLLERVDKKRYLNRGKYIRHDKVKQDLRQAEGALRQIGIIADYYESTGASGGKVCNFVINEKWLAEEKKRIQRLLPPGETLEEPKGEETNPGDEAL